MPPRTKLTFELSSTTTGRLVIYNGPYIIGWIEYFGSSRAYVFKPRYTEIPKRGEHRFRVAELEQIVLKLKELNGADIP